MRKLSMFEYCCLRGVGGIWRKNYTSNFEVRRKVLGYLEQEVNTNKLKSLGHV